MNAINWKKRILPNIPYLLFVYLFDKVGQAVRLAPGADLSGKVLSLGEGFSMAFATPRPSLAPMDLLTGIFGAVLIRLIVYVKGKNAKKYRVGVGLYIFGSPPTGRAVFDTFPVFLRVLAFEVHHKPDKDSPRNTDKQIHRVKTRQGI